MNPSTRSSSSLGTSRGLRIALLWILFSLISLVTYAVSQSMGSGTFDAAAAFLSGEHDIDVVLYADRAEPASVEVETGQRVVFIVGDDSRHDMAEERTQRREARLASGEIEKGDSFSVAFRESGSLSFYDRMNQDIHVSVTVR